jgi:hypothetical protein
MNTFTSFDGIRIAYHDEGEGPAVILLHGGYVDGLGQFGDFERILPLLEKQQEMFREVFGGALPLPNPPSKEGQAWSAHYWQRVHAPSCRTCAVSALPTNRERKQHTKTQPWPETW